MRWLAHGLLLVAAFSGATIWLQRQSAAVLRAEVALLREEGRKLPGLRVEHERLKAAQVSEADLQRLRSDHAAVVRLRTEINELRTRAGQMERDAADDEKAAMRPADVPAPAAAPAATLELQVNNDGGFFLENQPLDLVALRQRLGVVPQGQRVLLQVRMPEGSLAKGANVARQLEGVATVIKELKLRFELRLVQPDQVNE